MPKIEKIDKMAKPYFKKTRNKSFMEIPKEFEELENETEKWYQEVWLLIIIFFLIYMCQFN